MNGQRSSRIWLAAGVLAMVLTVVGAAIAWTAVTRIGRSLDQTAAIAEETLDAVDETMAAAALALDSAVDGVDEAATALDETDRAFEVTEGALSDLSGIVGDDLASSVASIEGVLPDLRRAGDVIDSAVGTLSLLGIDSGSGTGLGSGLADIEASLDGVAARLRAQSSDIDAISSSIGVVDGAVARLGGDLASLSAALGRARDTLDAYEQATADLRVLLALSPSRDVVGPLRALIMIGAAVALIALTPLVAPRRAQNA